MRRRRRASPRSNSCFPTIIRRKQVGKRLKGNGLTQALFNLPPGNWDAGEKGFAALPDRFDDLKKSLRHRAALCQGDRRQARCI